jgi:hypothetical protein
VVLSFKRITGVVVGRFGVLLYLDNLAVPIALVSDSRCQRLIDRFGANDKLPSAIESYSVFGHRGSFRCGAVVHQATIDYQHNPVSAMSTRQSREKDRIRVGALPGAKKN